MTEPAKIQQALNRFLKGLWSNLTLAFAFLLILDLIFVGLLFFFLYWQKMSEEIETSPGLRINPVLLENIEAIWQEKEAAFQKALTKDYPDPFNDPTPE